MEILGGHLTWVSLSLLLNKMGAYERYLLGSFWGLHTCWIYFVSLEAIWTQAGIIRSLHDWSSWWKMEVGIHTVQLFYVGRSTWVGDIEDISVENFGCYDYWIYHFVCVISYLLMVVKILTTLFQALSLRTHFWKPDYKQGFWPPLHRHTFFFGKQGLI